VLIWDWFLLKNYFWQTKNLQQKLQQQKKNTFFAKNSLE
jgi:hypothetical protein